jgi:hypothetical protein
MADFVIITSILPAKCITIGIQAQRLLTDISNSNYGNIVVEAGAAARILSMHHDQHPAEIALVEA